MDDGAEEAASSARGDSGAPSGWRLTLGVGVFGLALWTIEPVATLSGLLVAYAVAWLVTNAVRGLAPRFLRVSWTPGQAVAIGIVVALPALARGVELGGRLLENEGLDALTVVAAARVRLEETPSIAPPLVAGDLPQTFYVHAEAAREVRVTLGADGPALAARRLGHGLFRVEYDPRRDGRISASSGAIVAILEVDGTRHEREMEAVTPLAHPRWLARAPDGRSVAAVSEETDELIGVSLSGLRYRVEVDDGPTDVAFVDGERLAVAFRYASELVLYDAATGQPTARVEIGPLARHLAVSPAGAIAVTRGQEIVVVDPDARRVRSRAALEDDVSPEWVAFGGDDETLIVSSRQPPALHRLRWQGDRWSQDRLLHLGRPPVTMAASPDGRRVMVAVTDYAEEGPPHLGNHFVADQLVTVDVAELRVIARRLTATRTSRQESAGDIDRGGSPMGISLASDSSAWVAFAGTDDVAVYPPADVTGDPLPRLLELDDHPLGAPFSAVPMADGRVAVSSPAHGTIAILNASGEASRMVRLAPDDRALLAADERALQRRIGERTFYESTRSGVACQSCHLHGGSDGTLHNIGGSTLVATLDTRGLLGTPPYLRDGGYPRLGSLHELSQTLYRGFRRKQGGRRISLDAYLSGLPRPPPTRQLRGRDEARERRGLDAFVGAGCTTCHTFPAFTNLGQHPPRTLFEGFAASSPNEQLDTPSLLGLERSAPYLVDGRARTLREVFEEHDPDHRHGDTRGLTDEAMGDLVHFLEGL